MTVHNMKVIGGKTGRKAESLADCRDACLHQLDKAKKLVSEIVEQGFDAGVLICTVVVEPEGCSYHYLQGGASARRSELAVMQAELAKMDIIEQNFKQAIEENDE